MNSGFWWNKQCMKQDDSFWPHLSKDSRKQMLGTYEDYLRYQKKTKSSKQFVDEEEGGEE
jgi:hypothetical protein